MNALRSNQPARIGRLRQFSKIEPRELRWLWDQRLARGVSGIVGVGGRGKSMLTLWMTARLTNGELAGHLFGKRVAVVIASAEDPSEEVLWARLAAAGANLAHVYEFRITSANAAEDDPGDFITIPEELDALTAEVLALRAEGYERVVVFLDPLRAHLESAVDVKMEHEFRNGVLDPLVEATERYDYDIVLVDHLNKQSGSRSTDQRMIGAGLYNGLRSVLVFGREPGTEASQGRRAIATGKQNWSGDIPTLLAEVKQRRVTDQRTGKEYKPSYLDMAGEAHEISAEDIIEADSPKSGRGGAITKTKLVQVVLEALMFQRPEGLHAAPVKQALKALTDASDTMIKQVAKGRIRKVQDEDSGTWKWFLAEKEF